MVSWLKRILILAVVICPVLLFALENQEEAPEIQEYIRSVEASRPALRLYEPNYFLFYEAPVKFQFSIQYRLFLPRESRDDTGFYLAYTQKSLWDLWNGEDSRPFLETNYSPEAFYRYDYGSNATLRWIQGGWKHESNGIGGDQKSDSRSWDRIYLETRLELLNHHFILKPRVWIPLKLDENPDIIDYAGYGELFLRLEYFRFFHLSALELRVRKGWSKDWDKGSVEFGYSVGPFQGQLIKGIFPVTFYFQLWHGYGETLLTMEKKETQFRLGLRLGLD